MLGASGKVATGYVIGALTQSGAAVAPDLDRVRAASDLLASALGRSLRSRVREDDAPGSTSAPEG